ncbi:MAG: Spy/CpxP family protein refolding chaperone [Spirochaetaceae bacterium]|nr:Spy/CpxP family protein refolding chaperone [Spirochaetaceae bacterium]
MTRDERPNPTSERGDRRLIYWPLLLAGLTLALLGLANTVSAWGRGGDADPGARMRHHAEHVLDHVLDDVDATDAQRTSIRDIVLGTVDELGARRAEHVDPREALRGLLVAETIDREALEQLRLEHVARADEASRLVTQRLADALEVLTPEQRRALEDRFDRHFRPGRRHGHHGRHGHPDHEGPFGDGDGDGDGADERNAG